MTQSGEKDQAHSAARRLIAAAAVLSLVLAAGCQSWLAQRFPMSSFQKKELGEKSQKPAEAKATGGTKVTGGELAAILADGNAWSESVEVQNPTQKTYRARWCNRALEDYLTRPQVDRKALHKALAEGDEAAAANAAIALARLGDASGEKCLTAAVGTRKLQLAQRLAAAEALGSLPSATVAASLQELIGQYGDFRLDRKSQYIPRLHAELLMAIAKHPANESEPHFLAALDSPTADVRLAALKYWTGAAGCSSASADGQPPLTHGLTNGPCHPDGKVLPDAVADLTTDVDPRVRGEALMAVAINRHAQASDRLQGGLRDADIHARTAAIAAVGRWRDAAARSLLLPLLHERSSIIRAAAVAALSEQGVASDVASAAGDESWRVRAAVARALPKNPSREAAELARRLLADRNLEVQEQLLLAVAAWPPAACGPILLSAVESESPRIRKLAAELLAERWPAAAHFPYTATKERRGELLQQLKAEFEQQYPPAGEVAADNGLPEITANGDSAAGDEALELIARMQNEDVSQRRRAAEKLAAAAARRPLAPAAVERLAATAVRENDQLVWQYVLAAVAGDNSPAAAELAYAAVGHNASEVRRLACEHLAAHPHPDHAAVLLPALDDDNVSVAKAAVAAMGRCGRKADSPRMKKLLLSQNSFLQLETAAALSRLGDADGDAALRRLAYDDDPQIRLDVARAMGRSGNRLFVADLIRLLDDRAGVRREALAALELLAPENVPRQPGRDNETTSQRVAFWKQWYAEQFITKEP